MFVIRIRLRMVMILALVLFFQLECMSCALVYLLFSNKVRLVIKLTIVASGVVVVGFFYIC